MNLFDIVLIITIISDNWFAVKCLTSLWRNVMKPPFLQERACSKLKILPQTHLAVLNTLVVRHRECECCPEKLSC